MPSQMVMWVFSQCSRSGRIEMSRPAGSGCVKRKQKPQGWTGYFPEARSFCEGSFPSMSHIQCHHSGGLLNPTSVFSQYGAQASSSINCLLFFGLNPTLHHSSLCSSCLPNLSQSLRLRTGSDLSSSDLAKDLAQKHL